MENNIIKDRIQDVRERFLSGNQIEEIRQNVTSLVNERLDEFQNAQNNAFKELEVAIDKLENHQREMIAYFNKQLIALEEEQKASNSEVLKLASMQNFTISKSSKNKDNALSKNTFSTLKRTLTNNILVIFATVSLLGIFVLNFFWKFNINPDDVHIIASKEFKKNFHTDSVGGLRVISLKEFQQSVFGNSQQDLHTEDAIIFTIKSNQKYLLRGIFELEQAINNIYKDYDADHFYSKVQVYSDL